MQSYTQQLETSLKNHGIDASVEYDDSFDQYDITFTTVVEEKCISIKFDDILNDFGLVVAIISTYRQIDQQIETDFGDYNIKRIDNNKVHIELEIVLTIRDTTFKSATGTTIDISVGNPYKVAQLTFTRERTVSRASLGTELANEIQAIIDDVKQYSV